MVRWYYIHCKNKTGLLLRNWKYVRTSCWKFGWDKQTKLPVAFRTMRIAAVAISPKCKVPAYWWKDAIDCLSSRVDSKLSQVNDFVPPGSRVFFHISPHWLLYHKYSQPSRPAITIRKTTFSVRFWPSKINSIVPLSLRCCFLDLQFLEEESLLVRQYLWQAWLFIRCSASAHSHSWPLRRRRPCSPSSTASAKSPIPCRSKQ